MYEKDNSFEDGQKPSYYNVDKNSHSNHGPSKERPMKVFRFIVRVIQDDESLNNCAREDTTHGEGSNPGKRSEPPCQLFKLLVSGSKVAGNGGVREPVR